MVVSIGIVEVNYHRVATYESSSMAHSTNLSNVINLGIIEHARSEHLIR